MSCRRTTCLLNKGRTICVPKVKKTRCSNFFFEDNGIQFNQTDAEACFLLGSDFSNCPVKVTVVSQHLGGPTTLTTTVMTDANAGFCVPIPDNTTGLDGTIELKLKSDSKLKCTNACAAKSAVCGCFIQETEKCLIYNKSFAPYGDDLVWRTYNGSENNLVDPREGSVGQALIRISPSAYADGSSTLAERCGGNPNPRVVSNNINKSTGSRLNSSNLTDITWMWGQFIDHEIDLTPADSGEDASFTTPTVMEDPEEEFPGRTISFTRSGFIAGTDPREQPNHISSFLDATNVYGYSTERAFELRLLDGSGKMKTTTADNGEILLPYNTSGMRNEDLHSPNPENFFLAGDIRANENTNLISMHTLFVREHNRLCDEISARFPVWEGQDELIFQHARRFISGFQQTITFHEFLPGLLGPESPEDWQFYDKSVCPNTSTEFSTAFFRLGHSMLSSNLKIGTSGTLLLRDSFFNPAYIQTNGIDDILQGGFLQVMQEIDNEVVDDIRNFLFGPPTATNLLDLASLNIQRGRDHGLPDYNTCRVAFGLAPKTTFAEITSDTTLQTKLANVYTSVDCIDPWVGAICEDHAPGAAVGELICVSLKDQFTRLRDGDRFWFENDNALSDIEKAEIRTTTLADIIRRNTSLSDSDVPDDVFHFITP
tara:strand:- start:3563 stop:5530 length:1968 start_codon:yes stop_codon:yes gene_type:complete